jgi:predicted DNA-binding antitoxin AbrB/MazE fold protein
MVRHVDAIFISGTFRPVEPLALPEGTRVHLRVEEEATTTPLPRTAKIHSPRLARPEDAAKFAMEVREIDDAGL